MKGVFVLNCGSSSIKFQLIEPKSGKVYLKGIAENLGTPRATLKWGEETKNLGKSDYSSALGEIVKLLGDAEMIGVGHRVVHGGEFFKDSTLIQGDVLENIKACNPLAPLHNPVNVLGIETMQKHFPNLPQVAVFDTAFHQTMPEEAYVYGLPYEYYEKYRVRRYGFHGISHRYVVAQGADKVGKLLDETAFISCHLGNGCSIAAVLGGKSLDTSMGLTPLEGVMMGQRSGDVDPGVVGFLMKELSCDIDEVTAILNKKSGLLGVSGLSEDMRLLLESSEKRAHLAINIFCYRIAKCIASYLVPLQTVDGVIFTGGIGENASQIREQIMRHLQLLNLPSFVIPTNEELLIAQDTEDIIGEEQ